MLFLMLAFIASTYRSAMLGERDFLRSQRKKHRDIEANARF
jgi:hypothetical protein